MNSTAPRIALIFFIAIGFCLGVGVGCAVLIHAAKEDQNTIAAQRQLIQMNNETYQKR